MSIKVMAWVWEHAPSKGTQLLALLALADFCNDEGECYPGTKTLARKTRVSVTSLHQVLHGLESTQQIGIWNGKGVSANGGVTNRYFVNGYRENVGLTAIRTQTHNETKQQKERQETSFVRTGVPPVKTGVQNPSVNPSMNPLSDATHPGIPGESLKDEMQPGTPLSGNDEAQQHIPGKKRSKKNESAKQENLSPPLDMEFKEAVQKCFTVGETSAFQIAHVLSGSYTKKPALNVLPPVGIDELRGFYVYWKKKAIDFPKNPQAVQDAIVGWRSNGDYQGWLQRQQQAANSSDTTPAASGVGKSGSLALMTQQEN